jgi:hypothetical protein
MNEPEPTVSLQLLRIALDVRMIVEFHNVRELGAFAWHGAFEQPND